MNSEERQWFHAWCLLFVFMCIFGSVVDIGMIVCLFGVGACFRSNALCSLLFFVVYMSIAMTRRSQFFANTYPSIYSLYIGPTVDPLFLSGIHQIEIAVRFTWKCMDQALQAIKNL